ncbi:hypothetical protein [Leuconostoc lactis]|uniref:hypothetical protein n=1 Tax=Leuconostoc lactis TaxID=1246 RepID=UPI0021A4726C|nr:hypothetical protein [Leuconostoc lactis]MCT3115620.1 hypothetical protein [Leuconostoc lactis]
MWNALNQDNKNQYKLLMTNFASLSEAFAQKSSGENMIIAPIINSKFQEASFKKAFNATIEDIGNSSYDASVKLSDGSKYIIGIKSFGVKSGFQKIAQFKKDSQQDEWGAIIERIKKRNQNGSSDEDVDDYLELANNIAVLRNKRISSSKGQLQGFDFDSEVEAVYHVLMPSGAISKNQQNDEPYILVGETAYNSIDIDYLKIIGPTSPRMLQNFQFTDGKHLYQYNSADSQLLMSFKGHTGNGSSNEDIGIEKWPVNYVEDPFKLFANLNSETTTTFSDNVIQSVTFMIKIERRSGFNAWYGAPKNKLTVESVKYRQVVELAKKCKKLPSDWLSIFKKVALEDFKSNNDKILREQLRDYLINCLDPNSELFEHTTTALWRNYKTPYEVYIPLPNSKKFHDKYPDFFVKNGGLLNGKTLVSSKNNRTFKMEFLPSEEKMQMFINQDNGKAIQSLNSQFIFGKWVLKKVFQLKDRELLTTDTLDDLGINAITFTKYDDNRPLSMKFTYVDSNNLPKDLWK